MSEQHSNEVWTEETINNGRAGLYDMQEGEDVHRYISDWYLTKATSPLHRRCFMPAPSELRRHQQQNTKDKYALHGLLLPKNSKTTTAVPFRLENFDVWAIDRSSPFRGVWVQSREAWYMLRKPQSDQPQFRVRLITSELQGDRVCDLHLQGGRDSDSDSDRDSDSDMPLIATLPDQATLNLELRAKFGLVSNLSDVFLFDERNSESLGLMKSYSKKTATELYKALKPSEDLLAMFPDRSTEPFDLQLLRRYPHFVREHMEGFYDGFQDTCTFMKSLQNPTKTVFTNKEFQMSALAAEKRGARAPWGELCDDMERIDPSWVMEAKRHDAAAKRKARNLEERPKKRLKKARAPQILNPPPVDAMQPTRVPQKNHKDRTNVRKDKKSRAEENREAASVHTSETSPMQDKIHEDDKDTGTRSSDKSVYGPERMKAALEDMKHFLVPTSELRVAGSLADLRALSFKLKGPDALKELLPVIRGHTIQTWEHRLLIVLVIFNSLETADVDSTKAYGKKLLEREKKRDRSSIAEIIFETWKDDAIKRIQSPNRDSPEPSLLVDYLVEVVKLIQPMTKKSIIDSGDKLDVLKGKRKIDWDGGLDQISTMFDKAFHSRHGAWVDSISAARKRLQLLREISKVSANNDGIPQVAVDEKKGDENEVISKLHLGEAERKRNDSERRRVKLNQSIFAKASSATQSQGSTAINKEVSTSAAVNKGNPHQSSWVSQSSAGRLETPGSAGWPAAKADTGQRLGCSDIDRWRTSSSWRSNDLKSTTVLGSNSDQKTSTGTPGQSGGGSNVSQTNRWGTSSSWRSDDLKSTTVLGSNSDQKTSTDTPGQSSGYSKSAERQNANPDQNLRNIPSKPGQSWGASNATQETRWGTSSSWCSQDLKSTKVPDSNPDQKASSDSPSMSWGYSKSAKMSVAHPDENLRNTTSKPEQSWGASNANQANRWGTSSSWCSHDLKSTKVPDSNPDQKTSTTSPGRSWGYSKSAKMSVAHPDEKLTNIPSNPGQSWGASNANQANRWGTSSSWCSHDLKSTKVPDSNPDQKTSANPSGRSWGYSKSAKKPVAHPDEKLTNIPNNPGQSWGASKANRWGTSSLWCSNDLKSMKVPHSNPDQKRSANASGQSWGPSDVKQANRWEASSSRYSQCSKSSEISNANSDHQLKSTNKPGWGTTSSTWCVQTPEGSKSTRLEADTEAGLVGSAAEKRGAAVSSSTHDVVPCQLNSNNGWLGRPSSSLLSPDIAPDKTSPNVLSVSCKPLNQEQTRNQNSSTNRKSCSCFDVGIHS